MVWAGVGVGVRLRLRVGARARALVLARVGAAAGVMGQMLPRAPLTLSLE